MRKILIAGCFALMLHAEIVDRLAITVDHESITELQLDEELRVTAFLNNQPVSRTVGARRAAADRLIEQLLIEREIELSRFPEPGPKDVKSYIGQVQSTYGAPDRLQNSLRQYDLTETALDEHLKRQLTILRFVEYRFRTAVLTAPDRSSPQGLSDEQMDEALAAWLEESRKQVNIVYIDKSLQ